VFFSQVGRRFFAFAKKKSQPTGRCQSASEPLPEPSTGQCVLVPHYAGIIISPIEVLLRPDLRAVYSRLRLPMWTDESVFRAKRLTIREKRLRKLNGRKGRCLSKKSKVRRLAAEIEEGLKSDGVPALLDIKAAAKVLRMHPQTLWRMIQRELGESKKQAALRPFCGPTKRRRWFMLRQNVSALLARGLVSN